MEGFLLVCLLHEVWWEAGLWEKVKEKSEFHQGHKQEVF